MRDLRKVPTRTLLRDLAAQGLRMPIGADLILNQLPNPEQVLADGVKLGEVVVETARRFATPIALPHMDLTLEKTLILEALDVPADRIGRFHFLPPGTKGDSWWPGRPDATQATLETMRRHLGRGRNERLEAHVQSIAQAAAQPDLLPVGMVIGPFSLLTKLMNDPITPLFLAGSGCEEAEEPEIGALNICAELALEAVLYSVRLQLETGIRALLVAEPSANLYYISPNQLSGEPDVFDRYVLRGLRVVQGMLQARGVELFIHCCGELAPRMLREFGNLRPALLSLGSSRHLWEDAAQLPKDTVLYGNLPTKRFFSDELISLAEVEKCTRELVGRMAGTRHPFILGSECDVISVPGCEKTILSKVDAFIHAH